MHTLNLPYRLQLEDRLLVKKLPRYIEIFSDSDRASILTRCRKIVRRNAAHITDRPSQSHIIVCSLVLAMYEQLLEKGIDENSALDQLTAAFQRHGRLIVTWIMRITLWLTKNPQEMIARETTRKLGMYGKAFEFDEEREKGHFVSIVNSCGYHDFFVRNLRPELTPVFCAWDRVWIDEIERQNNGIHFQRPDTIGRGGSCCRFEFTFDEKAK